MKHLTLNLEEEICLLDRYGLTPNELLVVRILLILQNDNEEKLFQNLVVTLKRINLPLREVLEQLQKKEVILKSYKIPLAGEKFDPYAIPVNKNFIKNLYKSSFEMGKELFEAYPQFGSIQGNLIPLRGVSRHFDSLEQAYFKYGKIIGWNPEKHNHIIELVRWAGDNNLINCSLSSFIINNSWLDIEAMKNGDTINFNPNTIKEL